MVRRLSVLLHWLAAAALAASVPAMAADRPDFSAVTSRDKAEALVRDGTLVRIYLFPLSLGGREQSENISYVPPDSAEELVRLRETLEAYRRDGVVNKITIESEYRDDSLVPTRIRMHAPYSQDEGSFDPSVDIW